MRFARVLDFLEHPFVCSQKQINTINFDQPPLLSADIMCTCPLVNPKNVIDGVKSTFTMRPSNDRAKILLLESQSVKSSELKPLTSRATSQNFNLSFS